MDRKSFLRNSGILAASMAVLPSGSLFAQSPAVNLKVGIIGVGMRGQGHLDLLLRRKDVDVTAIC
ncbi:MAG: gfo/Idh/MocA family oxidoreductase, partial [Flavitalea sp.]